MRILYILHQFYPEFSGGTERVTLNLAHAMQRAGHHVQILACTMQPVASHLKAKLKGATYLVHQGLPITLIPHKSLPNTADIGFDTSHALVENLAGWMEREGFNIAHVTHLMRMGSALRAIQNCGIPYLITLTDFFSACYRINLVDQANAICPGPETGTACCNKCLVPPWTPEGFTGRYQQAMGILTAAGDRVCPSEYVATCYRRIFPELEFRVIPHGIDMLALAKTNTSAVRVKDPGVLRLGFIGSMVPQKGLDILLHALAKIPNSRLQLRVIGGIYSDTFHVREVKRLVAGDQRVELVGYLPAVEVYKEIQEFDLLCVPSRVPETFSLALHEAAAAGVPALVSDLGAPAEQISQHGGGRVLSAQDVDLWASVIAEIAVCPQMLDQWRRQLKLPLRVEEEAFFYESLYRRLWLSAARPDE